MTKSEIQKRIEIYWNLNLGCWSVRCEGRVIDHADRIVCSSCELVVQPAGRARVRRESRKNVHAFVRASTRLKRLPPNKKEKMKRIYYNPFFVPGFVLYEARKKECPSVLTFASIIELRKDGSVWALNPR